MNRNKYFVKPILSLFFVFILMSCGEYTVNDKDIFSKKIPVFQFYIPSGDAFSTSTGFLTTFEKLITNGDTTRCEITGSRERKIAKIGFDGKIIWEKNYSQNLSPNFFTSDNESNFYNFGNNFYTQIVKLDSNFNEVAKYDLTKDKAFNSGDRISGLTHINGNIMLAHGYNQGRRIADNEWVTKKIISIVDINSGIQKQYIDGNETAISTFSFFNTFQKNAFTGFHFLTSYNSNKTKLLLQKFDQNLVKIAQKEIEFSDLNFLNQNNVISSGTDIYIIYFSKGEIRLMVIDQDLNIENAMLGPSFTSNPHFLPNANSELIFTEGSYNGYTKISKIVKLNNQFSAELILETGSNFQNAYFKNNSIFGIGNTNDNRRPNITILNSSPNNEIINKVVYNSEYTRKCNY